MVQSIFYDGSYAVVVVVMVQAGPRHGALAVRDVVRLPLSGNQQVCEEADY